MPATRLESERKTAAKVLTDPEARTKLGVLLKSRSLLVQLASLALLLYVLIVAGGINVLATVSAGSDIVCTCTHGTDHGSCPMHRTPEDSTRCRLQGTQLDMDPMSMFGPLMLPVTSSTVIMDEPSLGALGHVSLLPSNWIVPPEPQPPRR